MEGGRTSGSGQTPYPCHQGYTNGGGDQGSFSFSTCHADIFLQHYVHFRNKFIFIFLPITKQNTSESYCRHPIRAPVSRKHGIQRQWSWLTSSFCSQRISAMQRREGSTAQTTDFALAQAVLSASSFSLCTDNCCAKCQEEDRAYCEGNGNWSPSCPLQLSRFFLLWLFAWVLPSGSPIHFSIKM